MWVSKKALASSIKKLALSEWPATVWTYKKTWFMGVCYGSERTDVAFSRVRLMR